jgi:hypothetical protein
MKYVIMLAYSTAVGYMLYLETMSSLVFALVTGFGVMLLMAHEHTQRRKRETPSPSAQKHSYRRGPNDFNLPL